MPSTYPSILVVDDDDDPDSCHNLSDILTDLGWQVASAGDGHAALKLLLHNDYDLALLNWRVPGGDGLSICRAVRTACASTAVVLLAESPTDAMQEQSRAAGARQVIHKSLDLPRLLAVLHQAMELF
jgi:CheY-like chemotaxis protein